MCNTIVPVLIMKNCAVVPAVKRYVRRVIEQMVRGFGIVRDMFILVASLFLVAMPGATSSFLFLVAMPFAPSSVLVPTLFLL